MKRKKIIRTASFAFALVLLPFAVYVLLLFSSLPRIVRASYPKLDLQVWGAQKGLSPVSFGTLRYFPAPYSPHSAARDLSLVINHVKYPVSSLTTTTLRSLGFSVRKEPGMAQYTASMESDNWSTHFQFDKGTLTFLQIGQWEVPSSSTLRLGFAYRHGPAMDLPISKKQLVSAFGKPAKIRYDWQFGLGVAFTKMYAQLIGSAIFHRHPTPTPPGP